MILLLDVCVLGKLREKILDLIVFRLNYFTVNRDFSNILVTTQSSDIRLVFD